MRGDTRADDGAVGPTKRSRGAAGLSARQAAARLGASERTIRRAIARGDLAATKRGGAFSIALDDLIAFQRRRGLPSRRFAIASSEAIWPLAPPQPLSSLIGRRKELAEARERLLRSETRLLTLTGPGGVGKTRLALALAEGAADDFADGVAFVDLAGVTDPALVGPAIAHAVGARGAGDRPILNAIEVTLRDRDLLILLDNFEHLLPAATVVAHLAATCRDISILCTSRAPLRVAGEQVMAVSPLAPPGDEIEQSEAVQLFVARAGAVRDDFALTADNAPAVGEICRRVDGLPLSIELAAARCAVLSPQALLARFERRLPLLADGPRDAPRRHSSLHDAITWSYDLLSADEQAFFRRLAVYAGGFSLESAEWMMGDGSRMAALRDDPKPGPRRPLATADPAASSATLDLLTALQRQSLLVRAEDASGAIRFGMLETVREFALERLEAAGEADGARRRHAAAMLLFAEDAERRAPRPDRWWEIFEREWGNLRAALSWAAEAGEAGLGLRLGSELFGYWMLRGEVHEGIAWLDRLLVAGEEEPAALRGRAALALGYLLWFAGDLERVATLATTCVTLGNAAGDTIGAAAGQFLRGFLAEARGDFPAADASLREARDRYLDAGFGAGAAAAEAHRGRVLFRLGDGAAWSVLTAAIAELDPGGVVWGAATAYADLGLLIAVDGDFRQGATLVNVGLRHHAAIGDQLAVLPSLTAAALVLALAGDAAGAAVLAGSAESLRERAGPSLWAIARERYEGAVALASATLSEAAFAAAVEAGRALGTEDAIAAAREALRLIVDSEHPGVALAAADPLAEFTPRELDVLRLLAAGQTDREIAEALFISRRTVSWHVGTILDKLGASTRLKAVNQAREAGLIESLDAD